MSLTVHRLGALAPSALALVLLLPGPLACQAANRDDEEAAPAEALAAEGAEAAGEPLFSEKAREVIDTRGPGDAIGELSMLLGTSREEYVMDVDGLIALGEAYQAGGQPEAAVTATQIATFVDPESVDAVVALGRYREPTADRSYRPTRHLPAIRTASPSGSPATGW